jgi:chromosome segregation ATPase
LPTDGRRELEEQITQRESGLSKICQEEKTSRIEVKGLEEQLCHAQQERQAEKMKLEEEIRGLAQEKEDMEQRLCALGKESEEGKKMIVGLSMEKEALAQRIKDLDEDLLQVRERMASMCDEWGLERTALEGEVRRMRASEGQREQEWVQVRDRLMCERKAADEETEKDRTMVQQLKEQLCIALSHVDVLQSEQEEKNREVQEERERAKLQEERAREAEQRTNTRGHQLETANLEKVALQQELIEAQARLEEAVESSESQRVVMAEEVQAAVRLRELLKEELQGELRSVCRLICVASCPLWHSRPCARQRVSLSLHSLATMMREGHLSTGPLRL